MREKRWIIRGVQVNYLHLFISLILYLALTPIIVRYLGQFAYGLWAAFGSIMGYFGLLNFGMGTATTKYTAEYCATNNQEALSKLISSIFVIFILIDVLIILVCAGLTPFIPRLFHIPKDLVSVGQITFLIMGLNVALGLLAAVFGSVIYGYQRVDVFRTVGIIQAVANASFIIVFLRFGFGLIGVAVASILSVLIAMVLYLLFIHRSNYGIVVNPTLADVKTVKNIAPYSIRCFVLSLTAQILYRTDNIVISIFLGATMVTQYSIAYKLCFTATRLFSVISTTVFPTFSKLYALGDINGLRDLYLKITKISVAIVMPLAIFLLFFGHSFINLWVGKANFVGMNTFLVLILMDFIHSLGTSGILLQGIGKNKTFMYSEMLNAGLNLLLSIILVTRIGLLGVALGTLVAHLSTSSWIIPLLACKYTKLPIKKYLLSGILLPLLAGIAAGVITWVFIQNLLPNNSFFYLGLKGVLIIVIYITIYLAIGTTKEERQMYLGLLPRLR